MTYKSTRDHICAKSMPVESGCWEWQSYRNKSGYGTIKVNKKMQLAHRVSYTEFVGPIPDGLCVLHKCDNRGCVNPDHLWVGTNYDNVKDKVLKNRAAAKLKPKDVLYIRESPLKTKVLSNMFSISESHVNLIKARKTWTHL